MKTNTARRQRHPTPSAETPSPGPASATDDDAELMALFDQYHANRSALLDLVEEVQIAEFHARKKYPTPPEEIVTHRDGVLHVMTAAEIEGEYEGFTWFPRPVGNVTYIVRRANALAALNEYQIACRAIDALHDVSSVEKQAAAMDEIEDELYERILATPARTFAGVVAKLKLASDFEPFGCDPRTLKDYSNGWGSELIVALMRDAALVPGRVRS